uniref:C2H2-type domain-containing protein n=1 Tax=Ditylenchus dipsaci TaxID=166011 RepID=A0A915DRT9_9BILA
MFQLRDEHSEELSTPLIFQHVLRDKGALNVLLGTKAAKSDECSLVRLLLASPELLWKRGPLKTQSFPVVNPVNEISKGRLKKAKREKVEIRQDSFGEISALARQTIADWVRTRKNFKFQFEKLSRFYKTIYSVDEEPWMKLKTLLSKKCLEKRNSADCTPFKCKICGEVYLRQFTFEVHLAEKHLDVALEETA